MISQIEAYCSKPSLPTVSSAINSCIRIKDVQKGNSAFCVFPYSVHGASWPPYLVENPILTFCLLPYPFSPLLDAGCARYRLHFDSGPQFEEFSSTVDKECPSRDHSLGTALGTWTEQVLLQRPCGESKDAPAYEKQRQYAT